MERRSLQRRRGRLPEPRPLAASSLCTASSSRQLTSTPSASTATTTPSLAAPPSSTSRCQWGPRTTRSPGLTASSTISRSEGALELVSRSPGGMGSWSSEPEEHTGTADEVVVVPRSRRLFFLHNLFSLSRCARLGNRAQKGNSGERGQQAQRERTVGSMQRALLVSARAARAARPQLVKVRNSSRPRGSASVRAPAGPGDD